MRRRRARPQKKRRSGLQKPKKPKKHGGAGSGSGSGASSPGFDPGYNFQGDNPTADNAPDNWDGAGPGGGGGDFG